MTEQKKTTFADAAAPFLRGGWNRDALMPGMPGKKFPGLWAYQYPGRDEPNAPRHKAWRWRRLYGFNYREGLTSAGLTWEQVQGWETDAVCVMARYYPALDIDCNDEAITRAIIERLGLQDAPQRWRGPRCLIPFEYAGHVTWAMIAAEIGGVVHKIEWKQSGQWVASGEPDDGRGAYTWPQGIPETMSDLDPAEPKRIEAFHAPIVGLFLQRGAKITSGSSRVRPLGERHKTDDLDPIISHELLAEVLAAIPHKTTNVAGYGEAISLLASMRHMLGREGVECPDYVDDWCMQWDGKEPCPEGWAGDKWRTFKEVENTEGAFIKWLLRVNPEMASKVNQETERRQGRGAQDVFGAVDLDESESEAPPQNHINNLTGTISLLRTSPAWRGVVYYCNFRQEVILAKPVPGSTAKGDALPRPVSDFDLHDALAWVQMNGIARAKITDIDMALSRIAREHAVHPVRDYLNGLVWDGVPRLSTWLKDYAGVGAPEITDEDRGAPFDSYLTAVGRAWMISAVARVMKPGEKVDTALVLEGRQGMRKSTVFKTLCPDPDLFTDSHMDFASKEGADALTGKWVIEMAELTNMNRVEAGSAKAFLSRSTDWFRPAWGRKKVNRPRQCVFCGTTNDRRWLKDRTGGRRFWPVPVESEADIKGLEAARDELWAEAVDAYRKGERWWFDAEMNAAAAREQFARREEDPIEETILERIALNPETVITVHGIITQVLRYDERHIDRGVINRVTGILEQHGYEPKQGRFPWAKNAVRYWLKKGERRGTRQGFSRLSQDDAEAEEVFDHAVEEEASAQRH